MLDDPGLAGLALKPHAEALADAFFAAAYAQDIAAENDSERRTAETEALAFYCDRYCATQQPERDSAYAERVRRIAEINS
jgi:hypothetical protein